MSTKLRTPMATVNLKPFEGEVKHSLLQLLVNASAIDMVGWPVPKAHQRAVDTRASLYRPHGVSPEELPHAKSIARAVSRIFRALYARGWRSIGNGHSCLAFGHPSRDFVLRLRHTPCRDDPWLRYALWAQSRWMRSPALPRVQRIVKLESGFFFTYVAKMERLISVTECPLSLPASITSLMEEVCRNFIDGGEYVADLHPRNLMLRASDNQVVLLDPIASSSMTDVLRYLE
jgi:hypothetical protein